MTKQDWIELIEISSSRDWTDYLLVAASILAPVVGLIAAIYAAKSAKAAEKAANLSLEMYREQKEEQEKKHYPLFEINEYTISKGESITVRLKNTNHLPITNVTGFMETGKIKLTQRSEGDLFYVDIFQNFTKENIAAFGLNYIALNHHAYTCNIKLALLEDKIFLTNQENIKIN